MTVSLWKRPGKIQLDSHGIVQWNYGMSMELALKKETLFFSNFTPPPPPPPCYYKCKSTPESQISSFLDNFRPLPTSIEVFTINAYGILSPHMQCFGIWETEIRHRGKKNADVIRTVLNFREGVTDNIWLFSFCFWQPIISFLFMKFKYLF